MEEENKVLKEVIEWACCVLIALVIALLTRYYIVSPTVVHQKSMYPNLKEGQRLMLNRTKRISKKEYKRGDIITFEAPIVIDAKDVDLSNPVATYVYTPETKYEKFVYKVLELNKLSYIKRIIGVAGDRIQINNNKVYLNGEELEENYILQGTETKSIYYNDIVVPEGCVFVLGDNREESLDSRAFGCIPVERIEGSVWIRFWPLNAFGRI